MRRCAERELPGHRLAGMVMPDERWLLDRAMALLTHLVQERQTPRLVTLPPEGASLLEVERATLLAALERTAGNQRAAARLLRTTPRVMSYKIARYRLRADGGPLRPVRCGPGRPRGLPNPQPRKRGRDWRMQSLDWL